MKYWRSSGSSSPWNVFTRCLRQPRIIFPLKHGCYEVSTLAVGPLFLLSSFLFILYFSVPFLAAFNANESPVCDLEMRWVACLWNFFFRWIWRNFARGTIILAINFTKLHVIYVTKHNEKYFVSLWGIFSKLSIYQSNHNLIFILFNFGRFQRTRCAETSALKFFTFKQRVANDFPLIYTDCVFSCKFVLSGT